VVAAVNGFALGGGCELALAAHVRVAAEGARLGTPEVKLGVMCGYGGTQRLARLVGKGCALELLLTGEMIDAQQALGIGLVNRVVAAAELRTEAEALLRRMIGNAPLSLRYTLEAVHAGQELPLAEALRLEAALFGLTCSSDDMREGTRAFLEKRPPEFRGR
jgi:enoyl-CoA hydratase